MHIFRRYALAISVVLSLLLSVPQAHSASPKPSCKGETLRIYNKALAFYATSLVKLDISLQLRDLYDQKTDWNTKELYKVQTNDRNIVQAKADVAEYKPIVQKLAKSCKVNFDSVVRIAVSKVG